MGGVTAAADRTGQGLQPAARTPSPGKAAGTVPHIWALHGMVGARETGTCSGSSVGSAVIQSGLQGWCVYGNGSGSWRCHTAQQSPSQGGVQRCCEGLSSCAVPCQPLGLPEELHSSTSSFLGSLLQLSGALMPCLAPCQHPACAQALGPLAADLPCHAQGNPPASFHPRFLCPCPQAPCSPPCQTPFPGEGSGVGAACSPQAWALPKPCQASLLLVDWGHVPQSQGVTLTGRG